MPQPQPRSTRSALALLLAGGLAGWAGRWLAAETVTTTALTPDDQSIAVLVERPNFLDRNFDVRVGPAGAAPGGLTTIFTSPDEGRPPGSERLVWSADGAYLLVAGRHFLVEGEVRTRAGDDLYLLYHRPTGRVWCNARQARTERFGFADLAAIQFPEPVLPAAAGPKAVE